MTQHQATDKQTIYGCEYCENDEVHEDDMFIISSTEADMCNECHERFEWHGWRKQEEDRRARASDDFYRDLEG